METSNQFLRKPLTVKICGQLKVIVDNLLPFHLYENGKPLLHAKYDKIDVDTVMKYQSAVTKAFGDKVEKQLPEKFALCFDR